MARVSNCSNIAARTVPRVPNAFPKSAASHLCFEVDDVFASAERLRAEGIEFLEGPNTVEEGPLAGFSWIYLNTPWGQTLEIASFSSLGYEKNTPQRLWRAKA